jgi:hypothetical protein
MNKKSFRDSMICPCCGESREISSSECASCGAKQVGPPLAKPDVLLPKLGPSFAALACGAVVIIAFLLYWALYNDVRVGRMFLVWTLGDGYELTKKLLEADAKLPYYRIFTFDAYLRAITFSIVAVPLSLGGIWLARRALRLIKFDSASFGGVKIARASYCLSIGLLVVFSAVSVSSIPRWFANRRAKRIAATRALMYELHSRGLQRYYKEYGKYPGELDNEHLSRVNAEEAPLADYWGHNFEYRPVAVIASKGSGINLSDYKLISPGPDGALGTEDDITMINGVIVDSQNDPDAAELNQGRARQ